MMKFLESFFTSGLTYNVVVFVLSIFALVYSVIADYFRVKKRLPAYRIRTFQLVRNTIHEFGDVKITYKDKIIKNLATSNLVFWNKGKESIRHNDIATKNPIRIIIDDDYEILGHFIVKQSAEDNNFSLIASDDKKSIIVDFEFMEYNEGVSIRLLHTAPSSNNLRMEGKVISGNNIDRDKTPLSPWELLLTRKFVYNNVTYVKFISLLFRSMVMLVGIICLAVPILTQSVGYVDFSVKDMFVLILFSIIGLFYIYQGLFGYRSRVPRDLYDE